MNSLEMINISALNVGDVIKLFTDETQYLATGVIIKMESQKVLILKLNEDKTVQFTIKDSLLDDVEYSTSINKTALTTLIKCIKEIWYQAE